MKVLVLNCGSSSIKYQLLDMADEHVMAKGLVERIGIPGSVLTHKAHGEKFVMEDEIPSHVKGIKMMVSALTDPEHGVIATIDEIDAVGHRIAQGGDLFQESTLVTEEFKCGLMSLFDLAPLHNPPQYKGVEAMEKVLPTVPNVATFDTVFHQGMPPEAYMYALPYELYEKYGVRRYGFHGHSHNYVSKRAAALLNRDIEDLKIITCHLGNGSSVAAVKGGVSIDTSMGFTPLQGLVMGTRCGDIDSAIIPFLMEKDGMTSKEVDHMMNKESGALGLSGISSDFRDIEVAAAEGNERAKLTLDVFHYRIKSYIGAYAAAMNGVDAIVFTAGVGENSAETRQACLSDLDYLGLTLDLAKNRVRGEEAIFSTPESKVAAMVIPTNEEVEIARETVRVVELQKQQA